MACVQGAPSRVYVGFPESLHLVDFLGVETAVGGGREAYDPDLNTGECRKSVCLALGVDNLLNTRVSEFLAGKVITARLFNHVREDDSHALVSSGIVRERLFEQAKATHDVRVRGRPNQHVVNRSM